jgi:Enoyl-(Acyl carrier protein) reductase
MIEELGARTLAVKCDVTRTEGIKAALDKSMEAFGRLDFAFNNVGSGQPPFAPALSRPRSWTGSPGPRQKARQSDRPGTGWQNGQAGRDRGSRRVALFGFGGVHHRLRKWYIDVGKRRSGVRRKPSPNVRRIGALSTKEARINSDGMHTKRFHMTEQEPYRRSASALLLDDGQPGTWTGNPGSGLENCQVRFEQRSAIVRSRAVSSQPRSA